MVNMDNILIKMDKTYLFGNGIDNFSKWNIPIPGLSNMTKQ